MREYKVTIDSDTERWFNKDGELHRDEDEPAVIFADGARIWYKNGEIHRVGAPAVIYEDGSEFWYQNDNYHREDGPAVLYADGTKEYWLNGELQPDPEEVKELTVAEIEELLGHRVKVVK
jgi:hypothetical protein